MFSGILIGFTLAVLIHSITYGAMEAVKDKAARYFSGHISITGYTGRIQNLENPQALIDYLKESDLPIDTVSPRTIYYRSNASLLFNGESVRQRRLIGIDFEREYSKLSKLDFLSGSIDELLSNEGSKGVLISEVAARILGARLGDDITLYLTTDTGQFNSATMIVRGIFRETSLFGYVAYMGQADLNELLLKDRDFATDIAVYTKAGYEPEKEMSGVRTYLAHSYALLPEIESKSELTLRLGEQKDNNPVLAPLPLEVHLDQITSIMDAVKIVTWFIQLLFMVIIMVGILNTYRVLVYERTKEIGTLRAMGMTRSEIRQMFLYEAFFLDLSASLSGFIVFRILLIIIERIDISSIPGSGLFSVKGHLVAHTNMISLLMTFGFMLVSVIIAAWGPAVQASKKSPVDAMREES